MQVIAACIYQKWGSTSQVQRYGAALKWHIRKDEVTMNDLIHKNKKKLQVLPSTGQCGQITEVQETAIIHNPVPSANLECKLLH